MIINDTQTSKIPYAETFYIVNNFFNSNTILFSKHESWWNSFQRHSQNSHNIGKLFLLLKLCFKEKSPPKEWNKQNKQWIMWFSLSWRNILQLINQMLERRVNPNCRKLNRTQNKKKMFLMSYPILNRPWKDKIGYYLFLLQCWF